MAGAAGLLQPDVVVHRHARQLGYFLAAQPGGAPPAAARQPDVSWAPASKAALNMVTAMYAKELKDTPIKVNAANRGYCATDLNGHNGFRTPARAPRW